MNIDKIKITDTVKHKGTGFNYTVVGSINGAVYNDGEQDWVNVQYGFNPIHLMSFPLTELKRINKH